LSLMEKNTIARQDRKPNVQDLLSRIDQPVFADPTATMGAAENIILRCFAQDFKRTSTERYWEPAFAVCPEDAFGLNGLEVFAVRSLGHNSIELGIRQRFISARRKDDMVAKSATLFVPQDEMGVKLQIEESYVADNKPAPLSLIELESRDRVLNNEALLLCGIIASGMQVDFPYTCADEYMQTALRSLNFIND